MQKIITILTLTLIMMSCSGSSKKVEQPKQNANSDTTEVLYFHDKQRCITCIAIENLSREVVDSIGNDRVVMKIIDISKPENQAVADKYEVSWSALILVKGDKKVDMTETGFGYAKNQPEVFKSKLSDAINKIVE